MIRRNDILRTVRQRISDIDRVTFAIGDMETYLRDAVREYSRWRPQLATETVSLLAGVDLYNASPYIEELETWIITLDSGANSLSVVDLVYDTTTGAPMYQLSPAPAETGTLQTSFSSTYPMVGGDFPMIPNKDQEIITNLMLWKLYETFAAEAAKQGESQTADTSLNPVDAIPSFFRLAAEAKSDALAALDEPVVFMGWMR